MTNDRSADDQRRLLRRTCAVVEAGMSEGLHVGAQVYVSIHGETSADLAFGEARAGVPLRRDSLMLWMSTVKPVAAIAALQLCERGRIALDDPIARHFPEFAANGKAGVTLRHVLTHTGGFPNVGMQWSAAPWSEILAEICAAPLEPNWIPGERAAYHVASGWYVLAEIVRRRDGRDFARYVREAIFEPLGMLDCWIGMPREQHRRYGERVAPMHATEVTPIRHPYWPWAGSEDACSICRPGGSAWGPARQLGRLYESLIAGGELNGVRILQPATVEAMTTRQTTGMMDETFKVRLDRGLGVVIDSKRYGLASAWFGTRCSERAFGHGGFRSSVGYADPESGLVVAIIFNGMADDARHEKRMRATLDALYEDLA